MPRTAPVFMVLTTLVVALATPHVAAYVCTVPSTTQTSFANVTYVNSGTRTRTWPPCWGVGSGCGVRANWW